MTRVIGVRFRNVGKIYYFSPKDFDICVGDHVIVETARGVEYGHVVLAPRDVEDEKVVQPLKEVIRIATPQDDKKEEANRKREKEAYQICLKKIREHGLEMILIDVEFAPVSIKMAKEQNLSLNPSKISGVCGRLMCCLKNEEETYEELNRKLPGIGDRVTTADGLRGEVHSVSVLRQLVKVVVDVDGEKEIREYPVEDLKFRPRQKKEKFRLSDEEMRALKELEKK